MKHLLKILGCLLGIVIATFSVQAKDGAETYRVVVYDFESGSDDIPENLARDVADWLRGFLVQDKKLSVLERKEMARVWKDRSQVERLPDVFDPATATRIGRSMEANYAVLGKIAAAHDAKSGRLNKTIISARIVRIETGVIESEAFISWDREEDILQIVQRLSKSIVSRLRGFTGQLGWLRLDVIPLESRVKLTEEEAYAKTPFVRELVRGSYSAWIVPPSGSEWADSLITFRIQPGETTHVVVRLNRGSARLVVPSSSSSFAVYLDDTYIGSSPDTAFNVEAGRHKVTVLSLSGSIFSDDVFLYPNTSNLVKLQLSEKRLQEIAREHFIGKRHLPYKPKVFGALGGTLFVVTETGTLVALDAHDLHTRWECNDCDIQAGPFVYKSVLIVISRQVYYETTESGSVSYYSCVIHQVHPETGEILWTSSELRSDLLCARHRAGYILLAFLDGSGVLYDLVQQEPLKLQVEEWKLLDPSTLELSDSQFYCLNKSHNTLYSFELPSGEYLWSRKFDRGIAHLLCDDSLSFVADSGGCLNALARDSGRMRWRLPTEAKQIVNIQARSGLLYAWSDEGAYWEITKDSGKYRIGSITEGEVNSFRIGPFGKMVLTTGDSRVLVFDPDLQSIVLECRLESIAQPLPLPSVLACFEANSNTMSLFGYPSARKFTGWVQAVDRQDGDVLVSITGNLRESDTIISLYDPRVITSNATGRQLSSYEIGTVSLLSLDDSMTIGRLSDPVVSVEPGCLVLHPGRLEVASRPRGAYLWVDENFWATCPQTVTNLTVGEHVVRLSHPDRIGIVESIFVPPGVTSRFDATLASYDSLFQGSLVVTTSPMGAVVYIDGRRVGRSPITEYLLPIDREVLVRVDEYGYKPIEERFIVGIAHTRKHYLLQCRNPFALCFLNLGYAGFPEVRGWAEDSISFSGPVGEPVLNKSHELRGEVEFEVQLPIWRYFIPFARERVYNASSDFRFEWGWGIKARIARFPQFGEIQVGLSHDQQIPLGSQGPSDQSDNDTYSGWRSPPAEGIALDDSTSPLEEWDHPIPNVLVENIAKNYISGLMSVRFTGTAFAELSAGTLVYGGTLQGTALVQDDTSGHLVKDTDRQYQVKARHGARLVFTARFPVKSVIPFEAIPQSLFIQFRYQYLYTKFDNYKEQGHVLTLGIGGISFIGS